MPRKTRVVQKSRHSSLARPRPSATLEPVDWIGHPPDHVDEPKATPTGPFSQHSDVWLDDKELDLTADADDAERPSLGGPKRRQSRREHSGPTDSTPTKLART